MKLFLCFALTLFAFLVTNGKKIKIQIESEDLVNMFEGIVYSDVLQKYASDMAKRRGNRRPLKNPYHPEDEISNHFNDDMDEDDVKKWSRNLDVLSDSLDNQNENFLVHGNSVESDDILTDIDKKPKDESIEKSETKKKTTRTIRTITTRNYTYENIEFKKKMYDRVNNVGISPKKEKKYVKKIYKDDRANYKPVPKRFVLKGSNDTDTP